jgi:hypothetical protein
VAIFKHRFEGTLPLGTTFGFGWWAESIAPLDDIQADAVAWLNTFWSTAVAAFYDAEFSFDRVATAEITQATGRQTDLRETAVTEVGTGSGDSVPGDLAVVCSLRTATTARVGRGRFYIPGGLATCIDGPGRVDAAYVTALMAALDDAWGAYVANHVPIIYSRTDRQARPIVRFDIGDLWDTQRRREQKAAETRVSDTMPT